MKESNIFKSSEIPKKERVIVTGGTEGIGQTIAQEIANEQNNVAICARSEYKIHEAQESGNFVSAYQIDLADRHSAKKFIQNSVNDLGGLDILILNAAVAGMQEDEEYVFKVNEVAQIALTHASVEELRKNQGRIVFLTSAAKNIEGAEAYGKSKTRVEEWLREFAARPENQGIQIFSVNPGSCNTKMHQEILRHGQGEVVNRTQNIIEQGKLRDPKIVGKIISKMSLSGKKYNPETGEYDIPISQCEIVGISDENIKAEEQLKIEQ